MSNDRSHNAPPTETAEELDLSTEQQKRIADLFSRLEVLNLYELLGVPRAADKNEIVRAHNAYALAFHPDRFFRKRLGPFKPKLDVIYMRMTEARDVLCSPERRARYDAALQTSRSSVIEAMLKQAAAEIAATEAGTLHEEIDVDNLIVVGSKPVVADDAPPGASLSDFEASLERGLRTPVVPASNQRKPD